MEKKLIKVWTSTIKKAIICSTLEDMIEKGINKLNITSTKCKAFLEDGTELDDEEIFEALPAATVVYLLDENEKKPWEVSANISSETIFLETSINQSDSLENSQCCNKLTSPSPQKGLKFFAPWPEDFAIPTSIFSESLKKEAISGSLSWSSKSELLKIIAEEILKYCSSPSPSQRDIVARQLIKEFPNLKCNIGEGHEGWSQKIYDRVKNEARKRNIFSHKRKIFDKKNGNDSNLEYSPKVQKILPCEPAENTVGNQETRKRMFIEMEKMPGSRCAKIIQEGLKVTYEERRSAINSNILMGDLKNLFPALFTVLGVNYDFSVLYNIDLEQRMFSSLQACSSAVETYAKKKKKGASIMNNMSTETINSKIIQTIMLIPEILGEKADFLYKEFPSETNLQDFSNTQVTPQLCIVGNPFYTSEVYIVAERKNLIECKDFIEGIVTLMGLYFVVNIEYPKEAMATFKFFESYILKLKCKNLPGKLITFCKALP